MTKKDPVTIFGSAICVLALVAIFFYNWRSNTAAQQSQAVAPSSQTPAVVSVENTPSEVAPIEKAPKSPVSVQEQIHRDPVILSIPGEFKATIDLMGQGVLSVELDDYTVQTKSAERKGLPVVMGQSRVPFLALDIDGAMAAEQSAPEVDENSVRLHRCVRNGEDLFLIDETWEIAGNSADKSAAGYGIQYTLRLTNGSNRPIALPRMSLSAGALPNFLSDESNTSFSKYLSGSVAYGRVDKNDAKTLDLKAISTKMTDKRIAELLATPANWVGVSSKYFLFALRNPQVNGTPTVFTGLTAHEPKELLPGEFYAASGVLPKITLQPNETQVVTVQGYAGPKSYQHLENMGHGLPSILNMDIFFFWHFDWMGWICKVLLKALNGIAGLFHGTYGYGIAIIVITILVKLLFMPLAWYSTRSMKKMSALQPQLKAMREKYKEDPQRMYYEQQKLFKENGVSQTGGCLPMLVQIPIFFAMFNTFRGAIEIRNAGFLWVADLSMPDPIFGLPIHPLALMTGVTMFLQQRLQPMPDPNQAKMMNIMSLVFVFFFYNMPAGLTLYMTVNQLTSILQMLCFRRLEKRLGAANTLTNHGKAA